MMKSFVLIVLSCLLLTGCSKTDVRGYVVGKRHTEARSVIVHTCPIRRVHKPEKWEVWVADSNSVRPVEVSEEAFGRLRHGQFVCFKR